MTEPWPWPEDSPLDRRARIAHIYRDRLADEVPDACAQLDQLMEMCGQTWILGTDIEPDPEDFLTVREIAGICDTSEEAVRQWIHRWPLTRTGTSRDGRAVYRWGDVLDHRKDTDRHRGERRNSKRTN